MHEYSVARALLESVQDQARHHGARHVHRVELEIGELAGIEVDLLESAFQLVRERTVCAEARLEVRTVPATWDCPSCDRVLSSDRPLRCPDCDGPARLASGDEILLATLDMEIDDV